MMRVADYVASALADRGVRHVFLVTGGGAMFLNNAFGAEKRIQFVCNHHEQACAMAAEGYARVTGSVGVINVTSGPGGINALNGVFGAWTDSIPLLVVSGQVKRETLMASYSVPGLRQLGDQEADIIAMVRGITKYAVLVTDPKSIRYHLERALFLATTGRPGPCWLDIPIDVQSAQIDPEELPGYDPTQDQIGWDMSRIRYQAREVAERLREAKRPVILVGTGIRLAGAVETFHHVVHELGIPITTAFAAHDLLASDDPHCCGRPGSLGDRPGNFAVQNSDLLLALGTRLNVRQVSYGWKTFARHAYKIQVDIDHAELTKPTVRPDLPIHCDVKLFLEELGRQLPEANYRRETHSWWLGWCRERVQRYPAVSDRQREGTGAWNPYHFIDLLYRRLDDDDVVVCGDGSACVITFQVAQVKNGQRLFCNSGCASMGYDLPAAIGAAVARGGKRVICLAGDGSIQMNVQEMQTLAHHSLPVKVFVLNNGGYLSIRQSQVNFFKRLVGEGPTSGVSFPDMVKLAAAYGIAGRRIETVDDLGVIDEALASPGPFVAEVMLDQEQPFEPKLSAKPLDNGKIVSPPLEDMAPFLAKDELRANLLIPEVTY
jgi:acetolactate synthase-1/2/3 large subunit